VSEPEYRAAPLSALHGGSTSAELHFRRNHFPYPEAGAGWTLEAGGMVLSLADVRRLGSRSEHVVLECAGHRRTELDPPVDGLPWGAGAVSQGEWTGAPLGAVLAEAGLGPNGTQVVLAGADGDGAFARAISLAKATDDATLVAWELDGAPIPAGLGGPLRAIVPGHYAVDSVKWLRRIEVVAEPFRGHFQAEDYCLFGAEGVPDGAELHELPVSSLVTSSTAIAGVAWGGAGVARVDVRIDDGPWVAATLGEPLGPYAFVPWELAVELAGGPHTVEARATDAEGNAQPERPLWNRRGYANSSVHRVNVTAS
jgi:DMSO/TMAO reductase YedYZ molybdopterin-dependent catalytic subunit